MNIKLMTSKSFVALLTLSAAALILTACQKEEPKSPFEKMGESMSEAAKDMEKAAEKAAKEAEKAAEEAAKEMEKAAEEVSK